MLTTLATASALLVSGCGSSSSEPECNDEESCAANDDVTGAQAPFTLATPKRAQYPFVLHHGFNASTTNSWSYYQVKEALEADGQFVVLSEVQPFASVEKRAKTLSTQIDSARTAFCRARFPFDAFTAHCLIHGCDELGFLLSHERAINTFEEIQR